MSSLPLSTADVTEEVAILPGKGFAGIPATTIPQNWEVILKKHGSKPASCP
jgi:hypothetical protein